MIEVVKVWLTTDAVWIRTADGHEACEVIADYPRLRAATPEQRANYVTDEYGINWPGIDEDLSYEGFFNKKERTELYRVFMAHPELNASAVARRMGISQSLFAQYISGAKRPSKARLAEINKTLHTIGEEILQAPQYYRHFRNGKIYRFVAFATLEATEEEAVVYQAMYGEKRLWIRTKANFFEEVMHEGRMVPRFQLISNEEAEEAIAGEK